MLQTLLQVISALEQSPYRLYMALYKFCIILILLLIPEIQVPTILDMHCVCVPSGVNNMGTSLII